VSNWVRRAVMDNSLSGLLNSGWFARPGIVIGTDLLASLRQSRALWLQVVLVYLHQLLLPQLPPTHSAVAIAFASAHSRHSTTVLQDPSL